MKKETIFNLQCDWEGLLQWHGVKSQEAIRNIKKTVAIEIDAWRKMPWYKRLLNKMPEWKPFEELKKRNKK